MRREADAERVRALARDLGRHAGQRVRVYLTGGATAVLVGWRATTVDVYHFDPYSQVLAKLERGLDRDLGDARAMRDHGLIEPELYCHPAIDPPAFRRRVETFVAEGDR